MSISVCKEYSLYNEDTDEYFHEGDCIEKVVYYKDGNECSICNVSISNITQDKVTFYNCKILMKQTLILPILLIVIKGGYL